MQFDLCGNGDFKTSESLRVQLHFFATTGPHTAWSDSTWAICFCLSELNKPSLGHSSFCSGGLDLAQTWASFGLLKS